MTPSFRLLVLALLVGIGTRPASLVGQQVIDSCFTSVGIGMTFGSSANLRNRNADCINWTGSTWIGDWGGANVNLAPPGSTPGTRAIWMGDGSVWTTGGEGFALRMTAPFVSGVTYSFEFTRVSHGTGSTGNFAPAMSTSTGGAIPGTSIGNAPSVGSTWTTGIISFTASVANNGHTWLGFLSQNGGIGSGMFLSCGNAVVLPMELRNLEGWGEAERNVLAWEMYNEDGYQRHEIERSYDGETFHLAGTVLSTGSSDLSQYTFADEDASALAATSLFYRIRSVTMDGGTAESPVIEIVRPNSATYLNQIWPNPVASGGTLQFEIVAGSADPGEFRLRDALGREVLALRQPLQEGMNRISWSLPDLPAGTYLLESVVTGTRMLTRIAVQ